MFGLNSGLGSLQEELLKTPVSKTLYHGRTVTYGVSGVNAWVPFHSFGSSNIFMVNGEVLTGSQDFQDVFQWEVHPVDRDLYLIQKLSLFMPSRYSLRVNNLNNRASMLGRTPLVRARFIAL